MNLEEWKKKYGASASESSSDLQAWKNKYANFTPEPIETPQKIDVATRGIQAFGASGTSVPKITVPAPTPAPTPKVPTIDPRYAAIPQTQDYAEFSTVPKTEKKGVIGYFKDAFTGNDIYDYINDIDNYRNKVKLSATATNADNNYVKYDYMTPDEIGTYNYLNSKEGKDSAKEYLKAIDDSLNQRQGSAIAGNIKGKTGLEVLYGVNAGINQYKQGTKQLFSKESVGNTPVDYAAEIIREDLKDNGAKVSGNSLAQLGFDVLNTTANMAPSILLSTLGAGLLGTAGVSAKVVQKAAQILGATTMGASAGGQAYKQALDDGYTTEQARLYGTLVGASEGALQYLIGGIGSLGGISSEKLIAKVAGINSAIARMALTGAIKIGSEITEEELQNFLQPAFETLIFKKEYDLPTWDEVAYTAIITALSTGALSAGEIASAGKKTKKNTDIKLPKAPETAQIETQQTPSALPPQATVAPIVESAPAETVLDNALANPTGEGGRISNTQLSDIMSDQASMETLGLSAESLRNMTASQRRNAVRSAIDSYSAAEMGTAPTTPAKANLVLPQTAPIVQQTEAIPATDAETRALPPLTATDNAPTLTLPAKQSAPTGLQRGQTEQITGGIENGRTEITLPGKTGSDILRQGSERNIPQRQSGELGGVSGGTEAVRTGWQSTGIPKDSQRESLKYAEAVTADTILPEAQKDQTVYRDASETDAVRNSHSLAKKNGYVIEAWGGGEISIRTGGTIRAFAIPGTDRIGVQTDNNEIASEDLTRHEIMEQKILRGEVSVDEVLSGAEQYIDPAKIQEVIEFYHRGYPSEGIDHARSELVCDGADHINQLRYDVDQGRLGGSFKEFADLIDEVIGAINRTANEITDGAFELDGEIAENAETDSAEDTKFSTKIQTVDSEGNKLSPEQVEFFKDSKVRDENGNLLVVYHGTNEGGFTTFEKTQNLGYYFTDDFATARSYSDTEDIYDNITGAENEEIDDEAHPINYKVYLNISNPLMLDAHGGMWNNITNEYDDAKLYERISLERHDNGQYTLSYKPKGSYAEKKTLSESDAQEFIDNNFRGAVSISYAKQYGVDEEVNSENLLFSADGEQISGKSTREWERIAHNNGHDGFIIKNLRDYGKYGYGDEIGVVYVTFSPKQIKSIDNKNPTSDPDIRYSSKVKAEEGTAPVSQEIDSADTSLNQLPALFTDKNAEFGEVNIDIGGGEYDRAAEYLDSIGTRNLIFDPYNRPEDINTSTLEFLRDGNKADTATCANVLNVIREPAARANVILETAKAIKPDGKAYFMVYEGDGSGNGRITKIREGKPANWQNHRKTATYIDEIGKYFQEVSKKGKLLIATDPISNLPKASWEVSPGKGILYSSKITTFDTLQEENTELPEGVGANKSDYPHEQKVSEFYTNTLLKTDILSEGAKAALDERDYQFDSVGEKQSTDIARQRLEVDFNGEVDELSRADTYTAAEDVDTAMGILGEYSVEADQTGNYAKVAAWSKNVYEKIHQSAVTLQALDKYSRTPEGAVIKAQQQVYQAEQKLTTKKELGKDVDTAKGRKIKAETEEAIKAVKEESTKAAKDVVGEIEQAAKGQRARRNSKPKEPKVEMTDTEKAAAKLAGKVDATTKERKPVEANAINDMVNELFKSAKESPLPEQAPRPKRSPIEFLTQAINNKSEYADVWGKAKDILLEKYADNPTTLEMLNDYFEKGIVPTYSDATLTSSVKQAIKDLGTKLSEIKELSWTGRQKAIKAVTNYLVEQTGAVDGDAKALKRDAVDKMTKLIIDSAPKLTKKQKLEIKQATQDAMRKHGVPVESWADETGRLIADGVSKKLEPQQAPKSNPMTNVITDDIKKFVGTIKGTGTKGTGRSAIDRYTDFMNNRQYYTEAWAKLQTDLKAKYAKNPEALKAIDSIVNRDAEAAATDYYNNQLDGMINKTLKDISIKLSDLISRGVAERSQVSKAVTDMLMKQNGLDAETSATIANNISERFNEMLKERASQRIASMLKAKTVSEKRTDREWMNRLLNLSTFDVDGVTEIVKIKYGVPSLTAADVQKIYELNKLANEAKSDYDKRKFINLAARVIADKMPVTLKNKVLAVRRIAMLLNPKTLISRNAGGNVVFGLLEDIKDAPGTVIDLLISNSTGQRTTSYNPLATAKAEFLGAKKGLIEWGKDIKNGVDTSPTQHEMPRSTALKSKLGEATEKALYNLLALGDRPFFEAAYSKRIDELKRLGLDYTSEDAMAQATVYALERVFQNNSVLAQKAMQMRDSLGILGDIAIPFAQTPANIFDKLADYSPYGFYRAIKKAGTIKDSAWSQKQFVDTLSRALTGTGLIAFGFYALLNGFITGGEDKEEDEALTYQKKISGWQPYSIRFGDKSYTYDWANPVGTLLALGADIAQSNTAGETLGAILSAGFKAGINTMFNQSYLEGLSEIFGQDDIAKGLETMLIGLPASFTPTAFHQIAKLIDPIARDTYDTDPFKRAWNKVKAKFPGLSKTLPAKISASGEEMTNFQGSQASNIFESILSPGYVGETQKSKIDKEAQRLYDITGETSVLPNWSEYTSKSDFTLNGNGEKYTMTATEWEKYQKTRGTTAYQLIEKSINDSAYKSLTNTGKADLISDINAYANDAAKRKIFASRGEPYTSAWDAEAAIFKESRIPVVTYLIYQNAISGLTADKDANGKTVSGSKKSKVEAVIDSMSVSKEQKDYLYILSGYSESTLDEAPWRQSAASDMSLKLPSLSKSKTDLKETPTLKLPSLK